MYKFIKNTTSKYLIIGVLVALSAAVQAKEITLAFGQTPYDFQPALDAFSRQHNVTIVTPETTQDLKSELIKRNRKKRLPDIFIAPFDYTALPNLPLLTLDKSWFNGDMSQSALDLVRVEGGFSSVPLVAGNHLLLFYNKALVDQPARSWQELEAQKSSMTSEQKLIAWAYNGMYMFIPFLSAFDALPIQNNELNLSGSGMIKALEFYWTLPDRGLAHPECYISCISEGFGNGEIAYVIDGIWSYKRYSQELGNNLGVALLPNINNRPMQPYFSAHVLAVVDKTDQDQALVKKLALYLQSYAVQRTLWQNSKALPTNGKLLNNIVSAGNANDAAIIAQLESAIPMPNSPYMAVIWEAMSKGFNRYGADILNAKEASDLMQHLAQRTIDRQQSQ